MNLIDATQGYKVYATDLEVGSDLKDLGAADATSLDVGSPTSIEAFKNRFGDQQLDLLLNVAGEPWAFHRVLRFTLILYIGVMAPKDKDSLTSVDLSVLSRTFSTNTFGPLLLTQSLLPNLLLSPHPRIGNTSSRVGSIEDNTSGGSYAYRASKAALNSISKSMAMDLKDSGVVVVIMHPGYVKTGLDSSSHGLPEAVEPAYAAEKLLEVLLSKTLEDTGEFWHREGQELPW